MMHAHYETQLDFKRHRTQETLKRLGKIDVDVDDTLKMKHPYGYRHKAVVYFRKTGHTIQAGFFAKESHELVDIKQCLVSHKHIFKAVQAVRAWAQKNPSMIYDESQPTGGLHGLMIRVSKETQTVMMTLLRVPGKDLDKGSFIDSVIQECPFIESVYEKLQTHPYSNPDSSHSTWVWGSPTLEETLHQARYTLSPDAFFQINPEQMEALMSSITQKNFLKSTDRLLDAYCGVGAFAYGLKDSVAHVTGIDTSSAAIAQAQRHATPTMRFTVGKAEEALSEGFDVVLMDPPRKGASPAFLKALIEQKIERIIYVSCNVSTLARDLNYLQAGGYRVLSVQPVDMFPQTAHVESVTLLSLKKA
jgi:23S rRNA (uracil1939-C5)-methyltransferase